MKQSTPVRSLALAALLACAGAAQAQSSVQLLGLVDVSAGSFKAPGAAEAVKKVEPGSMTTSYWMMRGKEDLGSGLSAIFSLEAFFRADTGEAGRFTSVAAPDPLFARSAYVGLDSTSLGSVRLGRITTPLFVATVSFNAFGDSYGFSPTVRHVFLPNAATAPVTGDSGWSDSVAYSSPSFGGLKFNLQGAAGEGSGGRNWSGSAVYSIGSFAATAVVQDVKKGTIDDTRTWQAGASYDFGVIKVFAQYTDVENRTQAARPEYKLTDVSAAVPVGSAGKVLAAYGLLDRSTGIDRKTVSLAYDHYLSKRTDVYVAAMHDKEDNLSAGKSYAVGVRHRF